MRVPSFVSIVVVASFTCTSPGQELTFRTIAISGQEFQAPGLPDGVWFESFEPLSMRMNQHGEVLFTAHLAGSDVTTSNDEVFFAGSRRSPGRIVARSGDPAPGLDPSWNLVLPDNFYYPQINDQGHVAFRAAHTGPRFGNASSQAIFTSGGGDGTTALTNTGNQAHGLPDGVQYSPSLASPAINGSGRVAFWSGLILNANAGVTPLTDAAIFSQRDGSEVAAIAREGQQVTGFAPGVTFNFFVSDSVHIDDAGRTSFYAGLLVPGQTGPQTAILSARESDAATAIAWTGATAPGVGEGVMYDEISSDSLRFNRDGLAAFGSTITGEGVTGSNRFAIFAEHDDSGISVIARQGDQVPSLEPGLTYGTMFSELAFSNEGHLAFVTGLNGPGVNSSNNQALFMSIGDAPPVLIAREGDLLDLADPTVGIGTISAASVTVNDLGQVAFFSANTIFATTPSGELIKVLAVNDLLDVSNEPGVEELYPVSRIINGLNFNNAGELVFWAEYRVPNRETRSGIFVVSIPAPSTMIAMCMGGAIAARRRRT